MNYWDDMQTKWGFSDGEAVPPDAGQCREVYVRAVNTIAEMLGSGYRVRPYDRVGAHNWCLIVSVPLGEEWRPGPAGLDEALLRAIDIAHDMVLDQYVTTVVTVEERDLDAALTELAGRLRSASARPL